MLEDIRALQDRAIIVNGYAAPSITTEQIADWAANLTYLSCFSYGFTMSGELVPINDGEVIAEAVQSGVAPLMVLTPFDEKGTYSYELVRKVFTDPRMRDTLINNVVLTAAEKNYYGVVFNFGYIAAEDNQQFVITISKSSARLNRIGKLAIVSIVTGLDDEGIDYEAIGRAANIIELRTFRPEQGQSPPGAISPIDRIRETITRVSALADTRLILLGIPNYGYDWPLPFIPGRTAAESISAAEAVERANRTGVSIQYDEMVQSPHFNYKDRAGVLHEVWFDDEKSARARLALINEFNLAGVSIFSIMNPVPSWIRILNEEFSVTKV